MRISELRKLVRETVREANWGAMVDQRADDAIPGRVRGEAKKISQGLDKILKLVKGRKMETQAWKLIKKQVNALSPKEPSTKLPMPKPGEGEDIKPMPFSVTFKG